MAVAARSIGIPVLSRCPLVARIVGIVSAPCASVVHSLLSNVHPQLCLGIDVDLVRDQFS